MKEITNKQRNYLRKLAHDLQPVVQVGKSGLSEAVIEKVQHELDAHELIKIKFVDFQDQKQPLAHELARQSGSFLVDLIGNVAILFREHRDPESRTVLLPTRYTSDE